MDQQISLQQEHVVTIPPDTDASSLTSSSGVFSRSLNSPSVVPQEAVPTDASTSSANTHGQSRARPGAQLRRILLHCSGFWITIDALSTIIQIILLIVVLSLSRDEHPQASLLVWVIGYGAGNLAMLPLICWLYVRSRGQSNPLPQASSASPTTPSSSAAQSDVSQTVGHQGFDGQDLINDYRFGMVLKKLKRVLDSFFVIWFVVGIWISGELSSSKAPNLYRLCNYLLVFTFFRHVLPLILLCVILCCFLPYTIVSNGPRGAPAHVISALPTYKFKAKVSTTQANNEDPSESDGSVVAPGTEERQVSAEDDVCCICLGQYRDGVELTELPCTHHFHVKCVDTWLKINASCPLCKHEVGISIR